VKLPNIVTRSLAIAAIVSTSAIAIAAARAAELTALPQDQKDYLTQDEADKVRDAQAPADRIKLFMTFAEDRLQKFQYELARPAHEAQYDDILNTLMNAYVGCVDDAADQIDVAEEKQADVRDAVKMMKAKDTQFLAQLQKLDQGSGSDFEAYRYTLEDAIEGTKEAINDCNDAEKSLLPAPVRRKQQ
jgi:hypothetical protein